MQQHRIHVVRPHMGSVPMIGWFLVSPFLEITYNAYLGWMGWDGIYCGYWCRHRSKDCSKAHHLPSPASTFCTLPFWQKKSRYQQDSPTHRGRVDFRCLLLPGEMISKFNRSARLWSKRENKNPILKKPNAGLYVHLNPQCRISGQCFLVRSHWSPLILLFHKDKKGSYNCSLSTLHSTAKCASHNILIYI